MSGIGQIASDEERSLDVATYRLRDGARFIRHVHDENQVLWASSGVLSVATASADWVLPSTRALWIPAGLPHETSASSAAATIRSLRVRAQVSPVAWAAPTPITARPLLAELIGYLESEDLRADRRARAEDVLLDLIEPAPVTAIDPRMPRSEPARQVAERIARDPADRRTLEEWGREVGASGRTLARAFVAETGVSFGRWRTLARLHAALPALAESVPVSRVAARVGYGSASAFVAAFRRETGLTPMSYFNS